LLKFFGGNIPHGGYGIMYIFGNAKHGIDGYHIGVLPRGSRESFQKCLVDLRLGFSSEEIQKRQKVGLSGLEGEGEGRSRRRGEERRGEENREKGEAGESGEPGEAGEEERGELGEPG
jgi:hypothetical protein